MENIFAWDWLSLDWMVNLICYEKDVIAFLTDVQHSYRIQRAMAEDPNDFLLNGTRVIDDIISKLKSLDTARQEYLEEKKRQDEEKSK